MSNAVKQHGEAFSNDDEQHMRFANIGRWPLLLAVPSAHWNTFRKLIQKVYPTKHEWIISRERFVEMIKRKGQSALGPDVIPFPVYALGDGIMAGVLYEVYIDAIAEYFFRCDG